MPHALIIDDSPTDVHVFSAMLEKNGFSISSAEDAETGMKKAQEEMPDVILMDIIMPGLNGFQATRALSRDPKTGSIPIIIISTKSMETDRVWGLRQGAKDYLTKPISENVLLTKIRGLLEND